MTPIPIIIPIRLDHLFLAATHVPYAVVLESLVTLLVIESNAEFHTTPLVHNYIWLYHNYML